jgi:hypothetical protein
MSDLITTARARYNLGNLSTTSDEDTTLAALVTACSRAVRRHCKREFDSQQFDELYHGTDHTRLPLRQFPILSVARVAYDPVAVLRISNTSATNQRATAAVTATGLTLVRVASGVTTTDTSVTFAGNVTLSAVAAVVNALGNGWSATVTDSAHNNRASADLRAIQGALNVRGVTAELTLHTQEMSAYEVDAARGWLTRTPAAVLPDDWRRTLWWRGGLNYWRVIYTAGYATVPEDVQEACAQWVATLFWQTKRDPGLVQEAIPGSVSRTPFQTMPPGVRLLLQPYVDHKLSVFGG